MGYHCQLCNVPVILQLTASATISNSEGKLGARRARSASRRPAAILRLCPAGESALQDKILKMSDVDGTVIEHEVCSVTASELPAKLS